jgi:hypothetical protein
LLSNKLNAMKILLTIFLILFVLTIAVFVIDGKVIDTLSDDSSFKKWWRNNVIGVMEDGEI